MSGRKVPSRLRDAAIPTVPTVRADEEQAAAHASPEQETEAEAAVRRMVEAAYT
jgi:hypothetical protein